MPVTFNTSDLKGIKADSVTLNESQINRLMTRNKENALYIGYWDRFCDLFRQQKKAKVLEVFWNLMHPSQNDGSPTESGSREELKDTLEAFQRLRVLSDHLELFVAKLTTEKEWGRGKHFVHVDFSINGVPVRKMDFGSTDGADLSVFNLNMTYLVNADLIGSNLRGAALVNADLANADLTNADLTGANLTEAWLTCTNLAGANLSNTNLTEAVLSGADLRWTDLTGASLREADLTNTKLSGATYNKVPLTQENFSHYFPSACNVNTILWQQ